MDVVTTNMDAESMVGGALSPIRLRSVQLRNRLTLSPMCQYTAQEGIANDFHLVHLGKFAQGGFGLVFSEAIAVHEDGRITHGDLGLWSDEHIPSLRRITEFIRRNGAVAGVQLAHAGRKACRQRPWRGMGPLNKSDYELGDRPWPVVAPSAIPVAEGWLMPHELSVSEIGDMVNHWRNAARRALDAGFEVVEVHGGHGYLIHQFLSPLTNRRTDAYGGDLRARMRLPLEVAAAVRDIWPAQLPVFFRMSVTDHIDGGWVLEDSVVLAKELRSLGIDLVDCSSGGIGGASESTRLPQVPGFQVPFARRIKCEAGVRTMAVGLILDGVQADAIVRAGAADLVAVGREALYDPNWALHAEAALGKTGIYESWPIQYGWWLNRRARLLESVANKS